MNSIAYALRIIRKKDTDMAGKKQEMSPMMQKYMETKEEYKDCILFYRLGDFYEMLFVDGLTFWREFVITFWG